MTDDDATRYRPGMFYSMCLSCGTEVLSFSLRAPRAHKESCPALTREPSASIVDVDLVTGTVVFSGEA
jgi:hypothetical protein